MANKELTVVHISRNDEGHLAIEEKTIVHELSDMQGLVDGYIEAISVTVDGSYYDLFCNEEGKLIGLSPTLAFIQNNDVITDYIAGNCFFSKSNERGESISLDADDVSRIVNHYNNKRAMMSVGEDYYATFLHRL